jgi:hypothetical protein
MRRLLIGGLAAVALALGLAAGTVSADWVVRTRYVWDYACGSYVPVTERVWVPDTVAYAPGYYYPGYYSSYYPSYYGYRSWYYSGFRHEWRERHEHHEHHHQHH